MDDEYWQVDSDSKQRRENDAQDSEDSQEVWQNWKLVLIALGGVGGLLGGLAEGIAYAVGGAVAAILIYALVIRAATLWYRRFEWMQLGLIPPRVYAGICLVSGVVGVLSAPISEGPGQAGFIGVYVVLCGVALVMQAIRRALGRVRRSAPTE